MKIDDKLMVATYAATCVVLVILYRQYAERQAKRSETMTDDLMTHIDQVVEQKIAQVMVAQTARDN